MMHKIAQIQDQQFENQQLYPMTRNNGVTDQNHLFSKVVKASLDGEEESLSEQDRTYSYESQEEEKPKEKVSKKWGKPAKKNTAPLVVTPVYKSVKIGQAGFSGPNIKGSLNKAFNEKQPWTYRKEMLKTFEMKDPEGIKLMNSKYKVAKRHQIIEETQSAITSYRYNADNFDVKLDSNNKFADKFNNTADFAKEREPQEHPQTTFKRYYELQNQKLEFQKKNLIKLQKLQKERHMLKDSISSSMQSKDIGRLRDQYVKLKKYNDAALDDFKLREQLVKAPKYDKLEPIAIDNDPFGRDKHLSSKPLKISIQQDPEKQVTYKTGFEFFSHKNSIRKDGLDKFDRSNIDPEILKSLTAESTHSIRHGRLAPLSGSVTVGQNVFNTTFQSTGHQATMHATMTLMTPESHGNNSPAIRRETDLDLRHTKQSQTVSHSGYSSPIQPIRAPTQRTDVKKPQRYDTQVKEIAHQKKKNDEPPQILLGRPPLLPTVSQDVRISSNKEDTNLDNIMEMVMRAKIEHKNFDPSFGRKSTRDYIKGLVFEHSELAPYKPYVYNKKISDFIEAGLKAKKQKKSEFKVHHQDEHVRKSQGSLGSTNSSIKEIPKEEHHDHELLPVHLGANIKDFQRSKWLADNLSKKPYFEQQADQHKKNKDFTLDDPLVVKEREWQNKLKSEDEKFEEMVATTLDPLGIRKEKQLSPEKKMEIYDTQLKHYGKLFQKTSNNNIMGLPDYLDKFVAQDTQKVSHLVKKIITGKYNYKKDKELLKDMEVAFEKYKRVGGPLKKSLIDQYPGDEEFIKHLEKEYGYEHRTGLKPWQLLKLKQLGTSVGNVNTHPMLLNSKKTIEALSLKKEQSSILRSNPKQESQKEESQLLQPLIVGSLNRQSTLDPQETQSSPDKVSQRSINKIASDSNKSPPPTFTQNSSKLMPKLKIKSQRKSINEDSEQMNKTMQNGFPRENRSGGQLSNGNQYSDLGAEDRFAEDIATVDRNQPQGSKKFITGGNIMSSQGGNPGLKIDTDILMAGPLPRKKGGNPFHTSRVVKLNKSDIMTDQNTIDQTQTLIGGQNSEPSLMDTDVSPLKGNSNAKNQIDTTQKTNSTLPEQQSYNNSVGIKVIGDSGVMTDAMNVSQSINEAGQIALNISATQNSNQSMKAQAKAQMKQLTQHDKVFLTQYPSQVNKRSPKHQPNHQFKLSPQKTLQKATKTLSILQNSNKAAVSKIRLEVDSRVVKMMKDSKFSRSRSKSKSPTLPEKSRSQSKSKSPKKKRKRSATLNERVKKIKNYVNKQMSHQKNRDEKDDIWPGLQKYRRDKKTAPDIYEDTQISDIMHPGSEEWVKLVTERLYQLNRKLVERLGSTDIKSSSNRSKVEGSRQTLKERGKVRLSDDALDQTLIPKTVMNSDEQSLLVQQLNSASFSPKVKLTSTLGNKTPRKMADKNNSQVQFSGSRVLDGVSEQNSILSSTQNAAKTPKGSILSMKALGTNIQKFVDELEFEIKQTTPISEYSEFDRIHLVKKQEKQVKHAIFKYIEMMACSPTETDLENTIITFMEDRQVTKILFKENLLSEENLSRMKKDIFANSLKIASYGKRQTIWMPDKYNPEPKVGKRKAATVRFDKDGKAYYPNE